MITYILLDEYTQVKEELRLSRNILQNQNTGQRIPYLPTFSGDGGIALEHYISAIEAVKPTQQTMLNKFGSTLFQL